MSIDGTDFRITQQGPAVRGNAFGSHKYAGKSALRYELGLDILAGNLVWVGGPYPAGAWPDIKIFNKNSLTYSSQVRELKLTTVMSGTLIKSSAQITIVTLKRTSRCKLA